MKQFEIYFYGKYEFVQSENTRFNKRCKYASLHHNGSIDYSETKQTAIKKGGIIFDYTGMIVHGELEGKYMPFDRRSCENRKFNQ